MRINMTDYSSPVTICVWGSVTDHRSLAETRSGGPKRSICSISRTPRTVIAPPMAWP